MILMYVREWRCPSAASGDTNETAIVLCHVLSVLLPTRYRNDCVNNASVSVNNECELQAATTAQRTALVLLPSFFFPSLNFSSLGVMDGRTRHSFYTSSTLLRKNPKERETEYGIQYFQ